MGFFYCARQKITVGTSEIIVKHDSLTQQKKPQWIKWWWWNSPNNKENKRNEKQIIGNLISNGKSQLISMANRKINFRRRCFLYTRAARKCVKICIFPFHEMKIGLWKAMYTQYTYSCASNARNQFVFFHSVIFLHIHMAHQNIKLANPLWWDLKSLPLSWHLLHTQHTHINRKQCHHWRVTTISIRKCVPWVWGYEAQAFLSSAISKKSTVNEIVFFSESISIAYV